MIDITIEIKGCVGTGKTTLARAFKDFLDSKGFVNVYVNDFDMDNDSELKEFQEEKMKAIKDRNILIETIQIRKS
jgi:deoxyadenosine/deoxycytidine kinase